MTVLEGVCGMALSLTFLVSAAPKVRRPGSFLLVVLEYRVLPPSLAGLYAAAAPRLELLVGLLLLTGALARLTAGLAAVLLASFVVGVAVNVIRGREIDCGCFSRGSRRVGWPLLGQDLLLLAVAAGLGGTARSWVAPQEWSVSAYLPGGSAVSTVAVLAVWGLICLRAPRRSWGQGPYHGGLDRQATSAGDLETRGELA